MDFMKWIALAIVLSVSTTCFSQQKHHPGPPPEGRKELSKEEHEKHFEASKKALKDVGLSEEKQKKAIGVLKETDEKMRQLHENKSLKPEDAREKEKNILDASDKKLMDIMGEEKFKSWKEKSGKPNRPQHTN
jgi:hypothetical protein